MSQSDSPTFTQYIPGFEFLQNLSRQAAGNSGAAVPGLPPMSHWVAPTFDVNEIDKRIQDLKAVHFWLDQNTKALAATIQALEVQKMTLDTLQRMNVGLGEIAESFQIRPAANMPSPKPSAAAPAPDPVPESSTDEPAAIPGIDAVQWWNALTQQFQTIATSAMQDMAAQASRTAEQVAAHVQSAAEAVESPEPSRRTRASSSSTGQATPVKAPRARRRSSPD